MRCRNEKVERVRERCRSESGGESRSKESRESEKERGSEKRVGGERCRNESGERGREIVKKARK